jgi:hypothetical protein
MTPDAALQRHFEEQMDYGPGRLQIAKKMSSEKMTFGGKGDAKLASAGTVGGETGSERPASGWDRSHGSFTED